MPVITFKPHRIKFLNASSYIDENGDPHKVEGTWSQEYRCDAVQSDGGHEIVFEDGTRTTYSYEIVVDKNFREVHQGEKIRLTLLGGVEREHIVKGFKRYQLQCKIFV